MKKIYYLFLMTLFFAGFGYFGKINAQTDLWGMSYQGGSLNYGTIYTFNPVSGIVTTQHTFDGTNGARPYGGLVQANNGILYGGTYNGGAYGYGVLFKFNPVTMAFTKILDFDGTNGANFYSTLFEASNGFLYGLTYSGGPTYSQGIIFKIDPSNDNFSIVHEFDGTDGGGSLSSFTQAYDGLLYSTTYQGGINGYGVLFSLDPATDNYTKLHDFFYGNGTFSAPVQTPDGMLYGSLPYGGLNGSGLIYSYDPVSTTFTVEHDLSSTGLARPFSKMLLATDGTLYGSTQYDLTYGTGGLYSYDYVNNIFNEQFFYGLFTAGGNSYSDLFQAVDGQVYGYSYNGGTGYGNIFSLDINTQNITEEHAFAGAGGPYAPYLGGFIELENIWGGTSSSDWHTASNWSNNVVPGTTDNVVIPTGCPNFPTLTSAGDCFNITLLSDASGTATILDNGLLTIHGTAHVERNFSGNDPDWHLVSSPVSNEVSGIFLDMFLQWFDEANNTYEWIVPTNVPLNVMQGYGLYSTLSSDNTVTFSGNLNTGTLNKGVTNSGTAPFGWNLMGNPYASGLDWNAVIPGLSGINNSIYYLDAASGNWLTWNGTTGSGSRYIPPMQGFFVSASSASANLSVDNSMRTHMGSGTFYKDSPSSLAVIKVTGNDMEDKTYVHFNADASSDFDGEYDAYKIFSSYNDLLPQVFTYSNDEQKLSINELPETASIETGFTANTDGEYTFMIEEQSDFSEIILEDKNTGNFTDLMTQNYYFNYNTSDEENRFVLHFTPTAVEDELANNTHVYSVGHKVYVNTDQKASIQVYDASGKLVYTQDAAQGLVSFDISVDGVYMISLIGENGLQQIDKVFVK